MKWNRFALPVLALVAAAMGWYVYEQRNANNGQLTVSQQDGIVVLSWRGTIELPMRASFARAFEDWKHQTEHFVIALDSGGGSIREGGEVISLIQAMKQTHTIDTYVGANRDCMSMCVPVFLQGARRIAASNARFMFHEPKRFYDDGTEARGFSFEREALTERFFERYLAASPVDRRWLDKLLKQWAGQDIFKSGQELVDERSNIVSGLAD